MDARMRVLEQRKLAAKKKARRRSTQGVMSGGSLGTSSTAMMGSSMSMGGSGTSSFSPMALGRSHSSPMAASSGEGRSKSRSRFAKEAPASITTDVAVAAAATKTVHKDSPRRHEVGTDEEDYDMPEDEYRRARLFHNRSLI